MQQNNNSSTALIKATLPSTAIHYHTLNLAAIESEGKYAYEIAHADRSINPLTQNVYYLFRKWRETQHGKESGEELFSYLEKVIEKCNKENEHENGRAYLQRNEHKQTEKTWEGEIKVNP